MAYNFTKLTNFESHLIELLHCLARFLVASSTPLYAAVFSLGSTAGVMQQPTSHYYHATYGAELTAGTNSEAFLVRGTYLERPEFRGGDYADKDYGWFFLLGSKVTKKPDHGLYAYFGGGRMAGYTKDTGASSTTVSASSNYVQSGLVTGVEYAVSIGGLELAAEHLLFVGAVDQVQLQSYVAWPFTLFQIRAGAKW